MGKNVSLFFGLRVITLAELDYWVFISYSKYDERQARRFKRMLLRLVANKRLMAEAITHPASGTGGKVFLDKDDMPKNRGEADAVISEQVNRSQKLIVLCSPNAAQKNSKVNQEVQQFIDRGRVRDIHPVIIAGSPSDKGGELDCFPTAIRDLDFIDGKHKENGNPLVPDFRSKHWFWEQSSDWANLISDILGIERQSIFNPAKKYIRNNRVKKVAGLLSSVVAAFLVIFSIFSYLDRRDQENQLLGEKFNGNIAEAREYILKGDMTEAIVKVMSAWAIHDKIASESVDSSGALEVLSNALSNQAEVLRFSNRWRFFFPSQTRNSIYLGDELGTVTVIDLQEQNFSDVLPHISERTVLADYLAKFRPDLQNAQWKSGPILVSRNEQWVANTFRQDGEAPENGKVIHGVLFNNLNEPSKSDMLTLELPNSQPYAPIVALSATGRYGAVVAQFSGGPMLSIRDLSLEEWVRIPAPLQHGGSPIAMAFSEDEKKLAIAFASGDTTFVDLETNEVTTAKLVDYIDAASFNADLSQLVISVNEPDGSGRSNIEILSTTDTVNSFQRAFGRFFSSGETPGVMSVDDVVSSVAISPDGSNLIADTGERVHVFDIANKVEVFSYGIKGQYLDQNARFLDDRLAITSIGENIRLLRYSQHLWSKKFSEFGGYEIFGLSDDANTFVAVLDQTEYGGTSQLLIHRISEDHTSHFDLGRQSARQVSIAISSSGETVIVANQDGRVDTISSVSGKKLLSYQLPNDGLVNGITILRNDSEVLVSYAERGLEIFELNGEQGAKSVWRSDVLSLDEYSKLAFDHGTLKIETFENYENWQNLHSNGTLVKPIDSLVIPGVDHVEQTFSMRGYRVIRGGKNVVGENYSLFYGDLENDATVWMGSPADIRSVETIQPSADGKLVLISTDDGQFQLFELPEGGGTIFEIACASMPIPKNAVQSEYNTQFSEEICRNFVP